MKTLIISLVGALAAANAFAQAPGSPGQNPDPAVQSANQNETQFKSQGGETHQRNTQEQIGAREEIQYQQDSDINAQLQQARENVKIDERNIQKAEAKKRDSESQVDLDEASIKKYEAQLQEDKAQMKKLEERMGGDDKRKKDSAFN
jgi:hypothetical protein